MPASPNYSKNAQLLLGGVDVSAYADKLDMELLRDRLETTSVGVDQELSIPGILRVKLGSNGVWDPTIDAILAGYVLNGTTGITWQLKVGSTGAGVSFAGTCWIENYKIQIEIKKPIGQIPNMSVTGAVVRTTF